MSVWDTGCPWIIWPVRLLGLKKSADGLLALKWWQEGRLDLIVDYCTQDVRVTHELYAYGRDNGFLLFKNKAGHHVRIPVDWK